MEHDTASIREQLIESILAKQDEQFRWGFDEQLAEERPELTYYCPTYRATLWTLILLADLQVSPTETRVQKSYDLIETHFFEPSAGIYSLGKSHFPIPCLNGNMLYLHFHLGRPLTERAGGVIEFFNTWQRFDDGDFRTPRTFPYFPNRACYGKHTCYWGITKLLKGMASIPASQRTVGAKRLLENGIEFILQHEVCFRSHEKDEFINPFIRDITFPNLIHSDFLELLWLLAREGVRDGRVRRAAELLRSRQKGEGAWKLEKPNPRLIVAVNSKNGGDALVTERAREVLRFYG